MKISSYNVNSVKARLENLSITLQKEQPDVVLLQEIKCEFNDFPFLEIQTLGYEAAVLGQKSYNGVAILSKHKINVITENLPEFPDENARYIEADINIDGTVFRVASIYLPNGNPPYNAPEDQSKWMYKLQWMEAFIKHAASLSSFRCPVILGGDFNVILTDFDVYDPNSFRNNALFRSEVRQRLQAFANLGFYDSFRLIHPDNTGYTFWDYAGSALQNDMGMRIDYLWMNAPAFDRLQQIEVNKAPRLASKPSDHTMLQAVLA